MWSSPSSMSGQKSSNKARPFLRSFFPRPSQLCMNVQSSPPNKTPTTHRPTTQLGNHLQRLFCSTNRSNIFSRFRVMGRRWFRVRKAGSDDAAAEPRPWKRFKLFSWRLKGVKFSASVLDDISFRILYVVEAVLLLAGLCLFFFCCGCHI